MPDQINYLQRRVQFMSDLLDNCVFHNPSELYTRIIRGQKTLPLV